MKIINITEEQRENLCKELARITFDFRKDNRIECILFSPSSDGLVTGDENDLDGNVMEVTLVRDGVDQEFEDQLHEYNQTHQTEGFAQTLGFKMYLDTLDLKEYTPDNIKSSLGNSGILYARSGDYTKGQKETSEAQEYAEIYPPLDDALERALDDERMDRDSEAIKEFTKTPMFQDIMKMV